MGEIAFDVPQVRECGFYPDALEKGIRSERALTLVLAEMYVQGVSTHKVAAIIEQLCGTSVFSSQVSRAAALLDETLEAWRNRPLGVFIYLYLHARYEKVRQDGQIRDAAVLIAKSMSTTKIACELEIRENTVKGHVRYILSKLQLADRTQTAVYAWQQGIVRRSAGGEI